MSCTRGRARPIPVHTASDGRLRLASSPHGLNGGLRQFRPRCRKWRSGCRKCRFAALRLPFFRSAASQLRQPPAVVTGRDPASGLGFRRFVVVRIGGDRNLSLKRPFPKQGGRGATLGPLVCLRSLAPPRSRGSLSSSHCRSALPPHGVGLSARPAPAGERAATRNERSASATPAALAEGSSKVMIGEEPVPGLPETRRPDECPFGDVEAVSAELVVSPVPAGGAQVRAGRGAGADGGGARARGRSGRARPGREPGRCGGAVQRVARGRGALPAAAGPWPADVLPGAGRNAAAGADGAGAAGVRRASG
jgi:hypothetical protein